MRRFLVLALLILAACKQPEGPFEFAAPMTAGGRLCVIQCQQAQAFCEQTCKMHSDECMQAVNRRALRDYDAFMREQLRRNLPIDKRVSDFQRREECPQHFDCDDDCASDYRACYTGCGGKVTSLR